MIFYVLSGYMLVTYILQWRALRAARREIKECNTLYHCNVARLFSSEEMRHRLYEKYIKSIGECNKYKIKECKCGQN